MRISTDTNEKEQISHFEKSALPFEQVTPARRIESLNLISLNFTI